MKIQTKRKVFPKKYLFEGCPICDGMKKAAQEGCNLNEKDLRRLFENANKKGQCISF